MSGCESLASFTNRSFYLSRPPGVRMAFAYACQRRPPSTNHQPLQRGGTDLYPVWVGSKWLLAFPRVPVSPGTSLPQTIFSLCCPLNNHRRAARSFFKIGRLCLLILLLLLMINNINSNPGPVFLCLLCSGNIIPRDRSMQCCTCSQWVHLKCSLLCHECV